MKVKELLEILKTTDPEVKVAVLNKCEGIIDPLSNEQRLLIVDRLYRSTEEGPYLILEG